MSSEKKFGLLRNILRTFGLSAEAVDDVVTWIADLMTGEDKDSAGKKRSPEFPYHQRDNFLSAAELSFFGVLRDAVATQVHISTKVSLNDLFYVKAEDQSRFRIYTNKIDRKHVDFLLCHPVTMRPLVGIELDDKSHQKADRQARDEFVDQVFAAARLPLIHIPAKRGYVVSEIASQLAPYLGNMPVAPTTPQASPQPSQANPTPASEAQRCPKCGSVMAVRTAKTGANAGNQFWGCTNYPTCRAILPYPQ